MSIPVLCLQARYHENMETLRTRSCRMHPFAHLRLDASGLDAAFRGQTGALLAAYLPLGIGKIGDMPAPTPSPGAPPLATGDRAAGCSFGLAPCSQPLLILQVVGGHPDL